MAEKYNRAISDFCHRFPMLSEKIGQSCTTLEFLEIALRSVHAEFDRLSEIPDAEYDDICARSWEIRKLAAAMPAADGRSLLAKVRILQIGLEHDIDIACDCAGSVRDLAPIIARDVERLAAICDAA